MRSTFAVHVEKNTLVLLQFNQDVAETGRATISRFIGARISHAIFL
jgi:hypothetical protein